MTEYLVRATIQYTDNTTDTNGAILMNTKQYEIMQYTLDDLYNQANILINDLKKTYNIINTKFSKIQIINERIDFDISKL